MYRISKEGSKNTSLRAVVKDCKLFFSDFQEIQNNESFKKGWPRVKGNKFALKSRQFVLAIYFLFDLKFHSINAQRSAGTLIDKEQLRLDLLAFTLELKDHNSTHTILLLTNSVSSEKAGEICTVKEFLVSTKVTFKGEELTKDKFPIDFINLPEKFCLSLYKMK